MASASLLHRTDLFRIIMKCAMTRNGKISGLGSGEDTRGCAGKDWFYLGDMECRMDTETGRKTETDNCETDDRFNNIGFNKAWSERNFSRNRFKKNIKGREYQEEERQAFCPGEYWDVFTAA